MTRALGFTPEVYGFGAGIFFVGYFLLEIPGTLLVEKWSAAAPSRDHDLLGILASLTGSSTRPPSSTGYVSCWEPPKPGFFPGMIVYMSPLVPVGGPAKAVALS